MSTPAKYRKKPVEIEAMGPVGADNVADIAAWCGGTLGSVGPSGALYGPAILIDTLEGQMGASHGDFIIRGVKGEFYPCKPDIFEATYEPTPGADR